MNTRRLAASSHIAALVAVCMVAVSIPALAAIPPITGAVSASHPSDTTWYSDDSPEFSWDSASDLPLLLGSCDTPGRAHDVAVAGDVAYVADGTSGLQVIDISEPATPTLLGTCDTPGGAYGVAVSGDVAYVADYNRGLQTIDVSEPGTPTLLGSYNTADYVQGVAVSGDVAYVADSYSGLHMIDVSDPATPTLLGTYDTPGMALGVAVSGDVAYVADDDYGLHMIDVSDPASPTLLGTYDTPGGARGVAVSGDVAYVADGSPGLHMIDVSDLASPTLLGTYDTPGFAFRVAVSGDAAYVANHAFGLQVIDVSQPAAPTLLGSCDTPSYAFGVAVSGDVAYVTDGDYGLQTIAVSDFDPPSSLGAHDTPGNAYGVAVSGDVAYVADYGSGLQTIEVSDPASPTALGTYDTTGNAWGVAVSGDVAYVADFGSGLQTIDVSDPGTPTLLGSYDTTGYAYGVAVSGDVAYVADETGLRTIDVSEPGTPTMLGAYDTPDAAIGVAVSGDVAYVADYNSGLQAIDVSDPGTPTLLGSCDTPGKAWDVAVSGDVAYVADGSSGLQTIDVSDPAAPTLLGSYDTTGNAVGVAVSGDVAYVADGGSGLQVIDISDPAAPTLLASYDTPGYARGVAVSGDVAYVADDGSGLQTIDVGHGPVGYSYVLDQNASTEPDTDIDSLETTVGYTNVADGTWWFHVRAVGEGRRGGVTSHRRVMIDTTPPVTTSDRVPEYAGSATIELTPADGAGSGVASTRFRLDGATSWSVGTTVNVAELGAYTLEYYSEDNVGNVETATVESFSVKSDSTDYAALSGTDRYDTAIKTSRAAFADGTADCVVIATGEDWPDALGGAALAGAKNGPILLTTPAALSSGVITEIRRLGADEAIILGGTSAVSTAVESALETELGASQVSRVWGSDRYQTAEAIAADTITELGAGYDGVAFVGTGANFPDALTASPLAAAKGWPIFLANPASSPPAARMDALGVTDVLILGGTSVVSDAQEDALDATFGGSHVDRLAGSDRYATGARVATYGVNDAGLAWDGLAMSTGENFPDALAGGVLAGKSGSVMLLTKSNSLPSSVRSKLAAERDWIADVYYLGGTSAISQAVRDAVTGVLH